MKRLAPPAMLCLAACADLLGGLEEGSPRSDGGGSSTREVGDCSPWLEGFAYRVPFEIDSAEQGPLPGYSTRLVFGTRRLVASGKLRVDGADMRVTYEDGVTVAPHWVEGGLNGEATRVWTKLDVRPGRNVVYVYYGSPTAEQSSDRSAALVDGVIANATFAQGSAPWSAVSDAPGATSSLEVSGERARITLLRGADDGPAVSAGFCQAVTFPDGPGYRVVFDTEAEIGYANMSVRLGGLDGEPVWVGNLDIAPIVRGAETTRIPPGPQILCLAGTIIPASQGVVRIAFGDLRVRVFAATDPVPSAAGAEQRSCDAP